MPRLRFVLALLFVMTMLPALGGAHVQAASAPPNDLVSKAKTISTLPYTDSENTTRATRSSTELQGCLAGKTVWYKFKAPESGGYIFSTRGSNYDTLMSGFKGAPKADVSNQVACSEDSSSSRLTSVFTIAMLAGVTYYIGISANDNGGTLNFSADSSGPTKIALSIINDDLTATPTTSASPGTRLGVGVYGFTSSVYFNAYLIRSGKKIFLAYSSPGTDGAGAGYFTLPNIPQGTYTIRVEQREIVATTRLKVVPSLAIKPATGKRGAKLTFTLRGFAAKEKITIQWWSNNAWLNVPSGSSSSTSVVTSSDGNASLTVKVPSFAAGGSNKVRAVGATSRAAGNPVTVTGVASAAASTQRSTTRAATATPTPGDPRPEATAEPPVASSSPTNTAVPTAETSGPSEPTPETGDVGPDQTATGVDATETSEAAAPADSARMRE
ncbi:MAG: hypothetical protein QOJ59_5472 [Thermomicrobiales bacterium]|nr:hypothetical protein [Thermomicrobiales bacterium]